MIKKLIARVINWACADETVTVGSIKVMHPRTTFTDTVQEKTTNAGVQVKAVRPDSGTEAPDKFPAVPTLGQLWFATDTVTLYVYIGMGQPGANAAGWFNLKQALYAP